MKYYIEILTCDNAWITYAVREDKTTAESVENMLQVLHHFNTYQTRIVI